MKKNYKASLIITLIISLLLLTLSGCGKSNASSDQETYKVIMTHELPESFPKHKYMEEFKQRVEAESNGQLEVVIHPGGQLFKDGEAIQALGTGSVHMVWPVSAHLEALNEDYGVISLPFILDDQTIIDQPEYREEMTRLLDSYVEENGIKVLGVMRTAEGIFLSSDKELKNIKDLSKMKIRTVSGHIATDMMDSLGATGVSLPATEIATSLSQGVIDGVNTSPDGWKDVVGTVANYGLVVPGMQVFTYSIATDKAWFENLPDNLQTLIQDTLNDITIDQWKESINLDKEYIEVVTNEWGKIHYIPTNEINDWKEKTKEVHSKFKERSPQALEDFNSLTDKYKSE
ncbi:TRAP transporter substrate-binding protein DctP [Cytobacillus sp. FSL R5-0569]|uniref:TRAP transporter substrate-binding protein n=1 Tax=Cytobacillus sp. FSL R5-0569 TaxID=2921649 RepID=UPI0030FA0444